MRLNVHTIQARACGDQKRCKRGEKPARASAGIACPPTTAHCPRALGVYHFLSMSSYFYYTWMDLWTIYRTVLHAFQLFFLWCLPPCTLPSCFFHTHTHSRLFVNFIHITLVTHWALLHSMPSCEHGTIHSSFFGAPGKLFPFCCCYKEHCYEHSHVGLPMWDFSRALFPQVC